MTFHGLVTSGFTVLGGRIDSGPDEFGFSQFLKLKKGEEIFYTHSAGKDILTAVFEEPYQHKNGEKISHAE